MEVQTPVDPPSTVRGYSDAERRERGERTLWDTIGTLYAWRRVIFGVTFGMAVVSVIVSLLLPKWYLGSARVLLPESRTGGLSGLLQNLPAAASMLLGGGGDYIRYRAILSSHSVLGATVDRFNLVEVYDVEGKPDPRAAAIKQLEDNVEFEVDMEYQYLGVDVLDRDPERAAAMANFLVSELNRINAELSSQSAAHFRRFAENRYHEALATTDSLLEATKAFQQKYGLFDLSAQTEAFLTQLAALRGGEMEARIQYEALRAQFGPDNAQVRTLQDIVRAANRQYQNALAGEERLLPVAQDSVPDVVRQYALLERDRLIQMSILEVIGPLYEQARFDEEREVEAVQVLDQAVPPVRKAKPKRAIIVIVATFSAFMLAALFALLYEWWRSNHVYITQRLRRSARQSPSA